jgi:1,4-dihydroxy-6-naphthoate synthase
MSTATTTQLRLAYSPDADDAFMFRAAIEGLVDTEGLEFLPVTADTQNLNDLADSGAVDISAISVAAYPYLADRFLLLPHGGSVGMGYGPVIVARAALPVAALDGVRIATPGTRTTAHLVTRMIAPNASYTRVPITPYEAVFDAVRTGDVDAGIIIHEGRLTYESHGMVKIVDLGEWWMERTGLPLPLGANVVRRELGPDIIARASRVLQSSIRWALDNRDQMIDFLIGHIHRPEEVAVPELLDRYLAMYANEETYSYSEASRVAFGRLLADGFAMGLIDRQVEVEFA